MNWHWGKSWVEKGPVASFHPTIYPLENGPMSLGKGHEYHESSEPTINFQVIFVSFQGGIHPGRLTWNLQITHLERKMIFQTSMTMFHVNLPGCSIVFFSDQQGFPISIFFTSTWVVQDLVHPIHAVFKAHEERVLILGLGIQRYEFRYMFMYIYILYIYNYLCIYLCTSIHICAFTNTKKTVGKLLEMHLTYNPRLETVLLFKKRRS